MSILRTGLLFLLFGSATTLLACAGGDTAASGDTSSGTGGTSTGPGTGASGSMSSATGGNGGAGGGSGGGATLSTCNAPGAARAVVAAVNGDTDSIAVFRFEDSTLKDDGLRIPAVNPRGVAMRNDGAEAIVGFGGFGNPYGVQIISITGGGAQAEVVDTIQLGSDQTPWSIAYASDDHAVLATAGPDQGTLVAFDRVGGKLQVGTTMIIPGNWPFEVAGRPGHDELILGRVDLLSEDPTQIFRVGRQGADWAIVGNPAEVTPQAIDMAVHPGGDLVYSPTSDPSDQVSIDNLDAKGVVDILSVTDTGVVPQSTFSIPGLSTFANISPSGTFMVLPTSIYEVDFNSNSPTVRNYALYTVPLDGSGQPGEVLGPTDSFPGLLFDDVEIATTGHLVTALELYPSTVAPDKVSPVILWAQPRLGAWEECQTVYLGGAVDLAIAP